MASPRRFSPAQRHKHRDTEPGAPHQGELTPPGLVQATVVLVWAGIDGWWTIGEILSGRIADEILFAVAGGLVSAAGVAQWAWVVERGENAKDVQRYAAGLFWLLCGSAGVAILVAHPDVS